MTAHAVYKRQIMRTSVRQAERLRTLLIEGLVFLLLVGLQLSCSGLGPSGDRRQISWSELSSQVVPHRHD